jgi:cell division protease FtsH
MAYYGQRPHEVRIKYSQFVSEMERGNLKSVTIALRSVHGALASESTAPTTDGRVVTYRYFTTTLPSEMPNLPERIVQKNPKVEIDSREEGPSIGGVLFTMIPVLVIVVLWFLLMRQMQTGGSAALKFGKSKAKVLMESSPRVTFKDVAGADEAKQELQEIIEFLRDPQKFQKLGGRIPKGALLLGAPGTGKTLLAKAVAGEAGVPFFSMSGSDFVEMFVGVGASRVRDLFETGKKNAPCIIFIDEIDAVGRHRGAGLGGGHDEREQTLNQLLVEMDGFTSNEGVILIAATNRPDVLDPALLRPGRFDRQIVVDRPDVRGREGILRVHVRNIPLADDVSLEILARGTPGLAGADLANLVNEAALLAARKNRKKVQMSDFEEAKDKVMMGTERRSLIISDEEKRNTAYHESGHALVAWLIPGGDPVHKVTIIPRGRALGLTHYLPTDDRYTGTREYLEGKIAIAMGGRVAEQLILHQLSTGAADDIDKATDMARKMVCEWGMSERLGPLRYGKHEEMIFLGKEISQQRDYSESTAILIDQEVRRLVEAGSQRAFTLLSENLDKLHLLASTLLEREVLDGEEITTVLTGGVLQPLTNGRKNAQPATGAELSTATGVYAPGDAGTGAPEQSGDPPAQPQAHREAAGPDTSPMTRATGGAETRSDPPGNTPSTETPPGVS